MPEAILRMATVQDADALLAIYAPYIETPVTFEVELPSRKAFAARIAKVLEQYPYLVCEYGGEVVGYSYAHRHKERAAYQWDAELSVYLKADAFARHIGTALYGALMDLLALQNIQNVYGAVTGNNERSVMFHASMGFSALGAYHGTGYKCGQWLDVCWFERRLQRRTPPLPVVSVTALPPAQIDEVLRRWEAKID